jgi:hypothetical protein
VVIDVQMMHQLVKQHQVNRGDLKQDLTNRNEMIEEMTDEMTDGMIDEMIDEMIERMNDEMIDEDSLPNNKHHHHHRTNGLNETLKHQTIGE